MQYEYRSFGELFSCPSKNGLTRPKKVRGSGLPMVNMGELFANPRIFDIDMDLVPVSEKEKDFLLKSGDLLFARQSLVRDGAGQCSIFLGNKQPTVFESHLIRCRLNPDEAVPEFYFYYFRSPEGRVAMDAIVEQGAGAAGIRGSDLIRLSVPVPSLARQREVADLLRLLDDRIDFLRQTNATLESIAQALFKSWFIDFDPVRAKAEGREPEGMDANTAELFPDSFEDSALGEIPKGWHAITLGEAFELNPSRSLKKGVDATYLEMANASTTGHRPLERVGTRPFGSGCKFRNGDALLAKITPCLENGKSAFVDFLEENEVGWGSTEFIVLHARPKFPTYCAYLLARHEPFRQFAIQAMTGTSGRQRIDLSRLMQFPLAAPPDERIAVATETVFGNMQARIAANDNQAKTLAALRDALLPGLISGKLRSPEAEAQLNEALA